MAKTNETAPAADYLHDPVTPSLASAAIGLDRRLYGIEPIIIPTDSQVKQITNLEQITNPNTRKRFVSSHEQSVRLFKQVGVDTPSIERYIANGLDLIYLTSAFEQIEDEGLEPEFVFYPVMPLWPKINNLISSNLLIVNNKTAPDGDVRLLAIEDVWQYDRQIFQQEKASVVNNPNAHYVEKDGSIWVASVISGTKHSQYLNQTLQESLNLIQIKDPRSNHAGLSQLVTLIALSLQAGKSSIGMVACTWTGQTFTDNEGNARAVCASCDLGHDVFVDSTGIDFRDYLIGARRSAIG